VRRALWVWKHLFGVEGIYSCRPPSLPGQHSACGNATRQRARGEPFRCAGGESREPRELGGPFARGVRALVGCGTGWALKRRGDQTSAIIILVPNARKQTGGGVEAKAATSATGSLSERPGQKTIMTQTVVLELVFRWLPRPPSRTGFHGGGFGEIVGLS